MSKPTKATVYARTAVNQMEIARRLGISQGTVHRALAGKGDVSLETREAVLRLASRLHYRRNASATALRDSRFGSIGLLARQPIDGLGRSLSRLITACAEGLRERDRNLILSLPPDDLPSDRLPRLLRDLCVDGLVVAGPLAPAVEAAVEEGGLPVSWIDNRAADMPGSLAIDERESARLATLRLLGSRRAVGFLTIGAAERPHYSLSQRLAGYREAMTTAGVAEQILLCPSGAVPEALLGHLRALRPPAALLCYNHVLTQLALTALRGMGRAVPGDVALVCCDDEWMVALQGVSTMSYDEQAVAGCALAMLCGEEPVNDRRQPGVVRHLVERESSRL